MKIAPPSTSLESSWTLVKLTLLKLMFFIAAVLDKSSSPINTAPPQPSIEFKLISIKVTFVKSTSPLGLINTAPPLDDEPARVMLANFKLVNDASVKEAIYNAPPWELSEVMYESVKLILFKVTFPAPPE